MSHVSHDTLGCSKPSAATQHGRAGREAPARPSAASQHGRAGGAAPAGPRREARARGGTWCSARSAAASAWCSRRAAFWKPGGASWGRVRVTHLVQRAQRGRLRLVLAPRRVLEARRRLVRRGRVGAGAGAGAVAALGRVAEVHGHCRVQLRAHGSGSGSGQQRACNPVGGFPVRNPALPPEPPWHHGTQAATWSQLAQQQYRQLRALSHLTAFRSSMHAARA